MIKTIIKNSFLLLSITIANEITAQSFTKDFPANENLSPELTYPSGASLLSSSIYKVRLVTRGTGTKTGASYLVWYNTNNSQWTIRLITLKAAFSNYPVLIVENDTVKIQIDHYLTYPVRAFVEELDADETDVEPHIYGSAFQWQRLLNDLYYLDGDVGIGTDDPDAKLTVKGKAHVQEVKVDMLGALAPDYVFESEYELMTLTQLDSCIKADGHLPEVPSAREMQEEGMELKAMNLLLLKKIEELTLYVIELQKEANSSEDKLLEKERQLSELEKRLAKIEEALQ